MGYLYRAVGGYLQGVFESLNAVTEIREKEESPKIGLDRTLRGKTRKEAARLFFETLVCAQLNVMLFLSYKEKCSAGSSL